MGTKNRLLSALPQSEYELLRPAFDEVVIEMREVLYEPREQIRYVYFPESAVVSLLAMTPGGHAVETATIGREGFVGLPGYLGAATSHVQALVQVPGLALRLEVHTLREQVRRRPVFGLMLGLYASVFLAQLAQSTACHRLHPLEQRCARWLLMVHDGREGDSFPLTHEFLSHMLGVSRPSVTLATGMLRHAGLISYSHGSLTVKDRQGLEDVSCECYGIIQQLYEDLTEGLAELTGRTAENPPP